MCRRYHVTSVRVFTLEKQAGRLEKHRKDTETASDKVHTRAERKASLTEVNRSAITDHVARNNHGINWTETKIMDRKGHCRTRQVKESIWIRKQKNCMDRDARD